MKKVIYASIILIVTIFTFTNGRNQKEIVDDVNIISAMGFDRADEDKVKSTAIIPVFKADKSISNVTFSGTSVLAREVLSNLQQKSADPLVTGSIKVALYGEELAKEGLFQYIDALQRDASIASNVYLSVVDGEAGKILEKNLGIRGTGDYLATMLEHNSELRDVPRSDLHTFLFRYFADGMDPYLPLMKLTEDKVEIIGMAIFKGNNMVDRINSHDMFFFKTLVENFGVGNYTFKLSDENTYASVRMIDSHRHIKVRVEDGQPKVDIYIYNKGLVNEYSGQKIDSKLIPELTKEIEKLLVKKCEELIKRFQEKEVDPVGIGYHIRHSIRDKNFAKKWWQEEYPNLDIKVHAKVEITETGIIE